MPADLRGLYMKYPKECKRVFRRVLMLALLLVIGFALAGCTGPQEKGQNAAPADNGKKIVTVTTSFLEDMVKQLAGDEVNIALIIPAGEDPHLYQAKPQDLDKIKMADLVLYHGLHFEGKMISVLEKKGHPVSANFPDDKIGRMDEDGQEVIDPHFWFDIDLYKLAVQEASAQLKALLPDKTDTLEANTESYLKKLDELKQEISSKLAEIPEDQRFLVTPHDAFNYFSREFHVTVVAPQGVSTDSEVANADVEKTAAFIAEHKIKAVFAESTTNPERMEKLREVCKSKGWDVKVVSGEGEELFSDSLAPAGQKGDNYLDMYRHNVELMVKYLK